MISDAFTKIGPPDENGCRKWTGGNINPVHGRPYIYDERIKKKVVAARIILEIKLWRPLLPGLVACHSCDNPWCVSADHLWEGTHQDNADDMVDKGRSARGEKNGQVKLTEEQVSAIRADNRTHETIANEYGVHRVLVSLIKRGERWGHLDTPIILHGRGRKGPQNHRAKLSEDQVRAIRLDPRSSIKAAPDYGVASSVIRKVRARTSYGHVL